MEPEDLNPAETPEPQQPPEPPAEPQQPLEPPAEPQQQPEQQQSSDWNWGFSLEEIFRLALKFFKEMNGKAFNPTYEENLRLVALHKQVSLGPFNPNTSPEIGFFDVLGNDRRKEWARLGSMAKEDAMEDFVKLLNSCCSLFAPYVTSHKIEKEEQGRRLREEEERLRAEREEQERQDEEKKRQLKLEEERRKQEEEVRRKQEEDLLLLLEQKQQIMAALNAQTTVQFLRYAQQQFPDSPEQQQLLIQQLQEQHYRQYIQQAYQVQQVEQKQQDSAVTQASQVTSHSDDMESVKNAINQSESQSPEPKPCHLFLGRSPGEVAVLAPSMWTRPQIKEFKEKMAQDAESVITVGRGEVLTVRVPTHEDGAYLFWEFATDHYDIGFGLHFEWPNSDGTTARTLPESASENQQAGGAEEEKDQSESCNGTSVPNVTEVVPIYRRDSHEEVYAGSHHYPGQGVYLLRFDNSYSLWRSKVVYYRVYYTR
ncbi:Golgi resident protein GCP60 isoform X1 [Astyanax mexicanus]|uniref:Golgi resident protein GCP60 isoform X1 n=1 Tax=Astyanax mexicanus TaxID=7994 RepID=UPI0020CAD4DE|nr:Golgi resident protein GCP60 isoform X1 [Astyanax mexicanus]